MFKIGIILPSLRLPWREGLAKAAGLGADGVQVWTAGGELDPAAPRLRSGLARLRRVNPCPGIVGRPCPSGTLKGPIGVLKGACRRAALDQAGKKDFLAALEQHGLEISALCADYGKSFGDAAHAEGLIAAMKRQIDFAAELGVTVIATHIGVIPEDRSAPEWSTMLAAMEVLGAHGDARGVCLATETGPAPLGP